MTTSDDHETQSWHTRGKMLRDVLAHFATTMSLVNLMSTGIVSKGQVLAMYARVRAIEQTSCAIEPPQVLTRHCSLLAQQHSVNRLVYFATCYYFFAASKRLSPLFALVCCKLAVSPSLCSGSCAHIFGICLFCFVLTLLLALHWLLCLFICMSLIPQRLHAQQKSSAAEPQAGTCWVRTQTAQTYL